MIVKYNEQVHKLDTLPSEMLYNIYLYLDVKDLKHLIKVNKYVSKSLNDKIKSSFFHESYIHYNGSDRLVIKLSELVLDELIESNKPELLINLFKRGFSIKKSNIKHYNEITSSSNSVVLTSSLIVLSAQINLYNKIYSNNIILSDEYCLYLSKGASFNIRIDGITLLEILTSSKLNNVFNLQTIITSYFFIKFGIEKIKDIKNNFQYHLALAYENNILHKEINNKKDKLVEKFSKKDGIDINNAIEVLACNDLLFRALSKDDDETFKKLLHYGVQLAGLCVHEQMKKCKLVYNNQIVLNNKLLNASSVDEARAALKEGAQINCMQESHPYNNSLHMAFNAGNVNVARFLITQKIDVTYWDQRSGLTVLHLAVDQGKEDFIDMWLDVKADTNIVDKIGNTGLHLAIKNYEHQIFNKLIIAKANLNIVNCYGHTPLHLAVKLTCVGFIGKLLAAGADPNIADYEGYTPLCLATKQKELKIVEILLNGGANTQFKSKCKNNPYSLALCYKTTDIAFKLLEYYPNFIDDLSVWFKAIYYGNIEIIEKLIALGVDINCLDENGNSAVHIAVQACRLNTVNFLIEAKANLNIHNKLGITPLQLCSIKLQSNSKDGDTYWVAMMLIPLIKAGAFYDFSNQDDLELLQYIIRSESLELLQVFIKNCKNLDEKNLKILDEQLIEGNLNIIKFIFESSGFKNFVHPLSGAEIIAALSKLDIDLETLKNYQYSPLHLYTFINDIKSVRVLCKNKISVRGIFISFKLTPLHLAAQSGFIDVIKELLAAGADVECSYNDRTPLMLAAENKHSEAVKLLVNAGADFNLVSGGKNAIDIAKDNDNKDIIDENAESIYELLLAAGADVECSYNDRTPLMLAAENKHSEAVKLLVNAGADFNLVSGGKNAIDIAKDNDNKDISDENAESIYEFLKNDLHTKWLNRRHLCSAARLVASSAVLLFASPTDFKTCTQVFLFNVGTELLFNFSSTLKCGEINHHIVSLPIILETVNVATLFLNDSYKKQIFLNTAIFAARTLSHYYEFSKVQDDCHRIV